jgi:hypothetical protein
VGWSVGGSIPGKEKENIHFLKASDPALIPKQPPLQQAAEGAFLEFKTVRV